MLQWTKDSLLISQQLRQLTSLAENHVSILPTSDNSQMHASSTENLIVSFLLKDTSMLEIMHSSINSHINVHKNNVNI